MIPPYQVMDPLTEEEYAALKESIALRGVLVPVDIDEYGNVLDGHHRVKICEELGITEYPTITRGGMSEEEKRQHAEILNTFRRQMSREDRAARILRLRSEGMSYRAIAEKAGVSHETVRKAVAESGVNLLTPDELPPSVKGKDGKTYPAARPLSVMNPTARDTNATLSIFEKSPELAAAGQGGFSGLSDLRKAEKTLHRAKLDAITETPPAANAVCHQVREGEFWRLGRHLLYCGDTSDGEFVDGAPACPFAFADPPYNVGKAAWDSGFAWGHDWLTDRAEVVAVTPGTKPLQQFLLLCRMEYRWLFSAWIENGMTVGAMGFQNVLTALLFSHGSVHRNAQDFMRLTIDNSETGDTAHPSRKPARFVARLMQIYSDEGDSVIDPFLGSGTTLLVAEQMGRAAYVGEINPGYCSEAIARWEAATGQEAHPEGL